MVNICIRRLDVPSRGDNSNIINLDIESTSSIEELKNIIASILSIPSKLILLTQMFNGEQIMLTDVDFVNSISGETKNVFLEVKSDDSNKLKIKKRKEVEDKEVTPTKDYLAILLEKCKLGSLSGFIQALGDCEREENSQIVNDDEGIISRATPDGWTLLHHACNLGFANIVQLLISREAGCNKVSLDDWTPMILAVHNTHLECKVYIGVRSLLKHKHLQLDRLTDSRGTALHVACRKGLTQIAALLMEHGASPSIADQTGRIPLEIATHQDIIELIPKYMGERQLKNTKFNETSLLSDFYGEAYYTSSLEIHDSRVFLALDISQGTLSVYNTRNEFIKRQDPKIWVKLIDIYEIKEVKKDRFAKENSSYFTMSSTMGWHKLYTLHIELTLEWINRINLGIKHCQENKIGIQMLPTLPESLAFSEEFKEGARERKESRSTSIYQHDTDNVNLKNFAIIDEIGSGSFGKVYKVMKNEDRKIYAMKKLNKNFLIKQKQLKYAIGECKILRELSHPFIIQLHYSFQTPKNLYIIMEYCPNGDLMSHLSERNKFPENTAKFYVAETILALEYLHSLDIVYRDLKPENILVDRAGHIRLADFGLAKENVNPLNPAMSFCGSPAYLAPELLSKSGSEKSADVYGLGAILFEMISGNPPFNSDNIQDLFRNIKKGIIQFPKIVKPEAQDLIRKLMDKDPAKRPTLNQIKRHIFFRDIDWEVLESKAVKPPSLSSNWVQVEESEPMIQNVPVLRNMRIDDEEFTEDQSQMTQIEDFNYIR